METITNHEPSQRFNPLDYGTASSSVCTKIQHSVAQIKSTVCVQRREGFSLSSVPGKVGTENIKPKMTGGKREIIDETFKDDVQFKETESMNNEE